MEPSLDLLVEAARAGGGWAFGRLWTELSPVVHGYVRARGARDPDDVTSEVFLAAFTRIGRFTGDGRAFRSWLFTIAHHKSVDDIRQAPREQAHEVIDDGRRAASAEDDALARLGTYAAIGSLAGLTQDQRAVLLLRVIGELSLEETAGALGKPVGAVKALQHRALARLRKDLAASRAPATQGSSQAAPAVSPTASDPMTGAR